MALIHDIQTSLLDEKVNVGSALLKLSFLAAKLEADILEEWIKHEAEGYPKSVEVPEYRRASVSYTGSFADIAKQISNVPISSGLVKSFAGDQWVNFQIRDGLPVIESIMAANDGNSRFSIDSSDLQVHLQDKIYPGMAILEIRGEIDIGAFARLQHAVRAKALDFTTKLEKQVPSAAEIEVGKVAVKISSDDQRSVENLTQNIFYDVRGDVTNIHSSGDANSRVNLNSTDSSANISE